jgi:ASC-1-like (ASCH) protein
MHESTTNSNMMSMHEITAHLFVVLSASVEQSPYWRNYFRNIMSSHHANEDILPRVHLAVLVEPYLDFILQGKKTVESRFSCHKIAPYERVDPGDIILLKRSGGPLVGVCQVAERWFYKLDHKSWSTIKREFTEMLCAQDPSFWSERESASFATLMRITRVANITPIRLTKRDRRGWVILHKGNAMQERLPIGEDN